MFRKIIVNILLRIYSRTQYTVLSKEAETNLLKNLAKEDGFERLPDYLEQCADSYRNHYVYSGNELLKGSILAMVQLRDKINEYKKETKKKNLTDEEKSVKNKTVY